MKFFPKAHRGLRLKPLALPTWLIAAGLGGAALAGWQARAALPRWMQDAIGGTAIESALYRAMDLPLVKALYPRPPLEATQQLSELLAKAPQSAGLYSLRAMEEEQALNFAAAEGDWKAYAANSSDKLDASLELADYYHRRLQSADEIRVLMEAGSAAPELSEAYTAAAEQRSWKAFERVLTVAADQGLDEAIVSRCYGAWIARYPKQPSLYARELRWLLDTYSAGDKFEQANALIAQYRSAFPQDSVFPLKASALVAYRRGSAKEALAIYDAGFTPLWPPELVQSYYALLGQTHQLHGFLAAARASLAQNPDDLNAMARLFYYQQQQGNLVAAQQVVEAYRLSKENRKASWSAQELYTLGQLTEAIHAYPAAARYNFALAHAQGTLLSGQSPEAEGLTGTIRILLAAPDQPLELGAGNLSMLQDIATIDQGPGYWNGILSLWLNSTSPEQAYHEEEQKAQPYLHRAKAADLLAMLDKKFPAAPGRADLHVALIRALAEYGESSLVLKQGNDFLSGFAAPANESNRVAVAKLMADAYARQHDSKGEFALYDRMLTELSAQTAGMPLTAASVSAHVTAKAKPVQADEAANTEEVSADQPPKPGSQANAFDVDGGKPDGVFVAGASEYRELLERYLGRLTSEGKLPQALAVLRKELDRNPNDPLLYERLATFLEQNDMSAQQEEVYALAIQKFQQKSWYDKLARLYLREKKREAFADLTRKVTGIFSGTDLEAYFSNVRRGSPELYLQLNLYAYKRFPHDHVFLTNLLQAYQAKPTRDSVAWEKLLREHWADSASLRTQFFDFLSRTGKLDAELDKLHTLVPAQSQQKANPAATRELAEAELWRSHFEAGAPLLGSLAEAYPADEELGTEASSVYRSLAYFDTRDTEHAVAIEKNLLAANPDAIDRLARIGDIYSDAGADASPNHENLAAAAPYWRRMPLVHPGTTNGYLQAATVFWDYFQFDDALGEIREARLKFHQPALFGYEAGALDEGKREFDAAIAEYAQAAAAGSEEAAVRLMQLARRKATAKQVDAETAKLIDSSPGIAALALRERVLKVQKRTTEIGPLLESALAKATSLEQAQAVGAQAQTYALTAIYEHALERQIVLAGDPVQKIELSYDLMRSYEGHKALDDANRVVAQVYAANPRLLGVVHATTDFYWRNKQSAKAISTLVEAAGVARPVQPDLGRQLLLEAASKANDSGNYAQARSLMAPLIDPAQHPADAYNPQYLAVVAESFARSGDDASLKRFYSSELSSLRTAPIPAEDRKQKIVLLRRGLIPALTRMKDYPGAVDQYIAILSAYPDDPSAAQEASLYALHYGRQQQLADFAADAVKSSPKDSRFAVLSARIETAFENYPAAIDAYARAIAIRSDRADIYTAKADLEERLQRLDDACKDYERLYVLSYQNPDWMVKIAAVRARQGRSEDAVKALERAWIAGHTATATDYFRVATQLESWQMLDESLHYAELGVAAEGDALLAGPEPGHTGGEDADGATIYARLLTRLRHPEKALAALDAARQAANTSPNAPSLIVEQAAKQGIGSVTDSDWRKHRADQRRQTAEQRFRAAALEMGKTVATYFTPEEKQRFNGIVDARRNQPALWIDVAAAAGIKDEEAKLRRQVLLDGSSRASQQPDPHLEPYIELEKSRMTYTELAQALEAYLPNSSATNRAAARRAEADAYRSAGDERAELRVLRAIYAAGNATFDRDRYLELLLKYDPAGFASFGKGSSDDDTAAAAPNYAFAHSDVKVTRASLSTRASDFEAPWQSAYSALAGLYFRDLSPATEAAFHSVLGDQRTIGDRIDAAAAHNAKPAQQLAGNVWFYYGMRYGVYRTLAPQTDWAQRNPEDLLAAELERNTSAANFIGLARAYAEAANAAAALAEYRHALELAPDSAAVRDAMALLLWQTGKKEAAIAAWRESLAALNRIQDKGPAPESFWTGFALIAEHLRARSLTQQLHPDMDAVVRNYIARNGNYRSNELLKAIFLASPSSTEGVTWIVSLSAAAANPAYILSDIDTMPWLPAASREPILLRELELAQAAASHVGADAGPDASPDADQPWLVNESATMRQKLLLYYVDQEQDAKAEATLQQLTDEQHREAAVVQAQITLASRAGTLGTVLSRFAASSGDAPSFPASRLLRRAAAVLAKAGDKSGALALREFIFDRGQTNQDLSPSDYLALAEARIDNGNLPGALEVLRRMTLLPGDVYAQLDRAAALLQKDHPNEALAFLAPLAKGVPWNAAYTLRLAKAQLHTAGGSTAQAVASLAAIAGSSTAPYELRVEAATALTGQRADASKLGSEELRLLAAGKVAPQPAQQPYYFAARVAAATALPDTGPDKTLRAMLLRQALAIAPDGISDAGELSAATLRLRIFRAEAAIGHDPTALEAFEALLNAPVSDTPQGENGSAESEDTDTDAAEPDSPEPTSDEFDDSASDSGPDTPSQIERQAPFPGQLEFQPDAEKSALAVEIATVYQHTGNAASALPYLKLAVSLQKEPTSHARLQQQADRLAAALRLEAQNALRQPKVQSTLDQSSVVRPRLSTPESAASPKEDAQ